MCTCAHMYASPALEPRAGAGGLPHPPREPPRATRRAVLGEGTNGSSSSSSSK